MIRTVDRRVSCWFAMAEGRYSVGGAVGGQKDCLGLSDAGRDQAERLAERLRRAGEIRADAVLASL